MELGNSFNTDYLRSAIVGLISATTILWWIWTVLACLRRLRENELSFLGLLAESGRSLLTTLSILTIIAFL